MSAPGLAVSSTVPSVAPYAAVIHEMSRGVGVASVSVQQVIEVEEKPPEMLKVRNISLGWSTNMLSALES